METKSFLTSVLGVNGMYCVWARRPTDGRIVQKFYPTIESLFTTALRLDADGFDAYFALGTFTSEGTTREAQSVVQMRALFLDLDCGPTKDYPDQGTALQSLREFVKTLKLPRPALINSGRGIHAYWPLTDPVTKDEWYPVALQLKTACREFGLLADANVTADAARILRVPGTHNYKDNPPNPVEIIGPAAVPNDISVFRERLPALQQPPASGGLFSGTLTVTDELSPMMQALSGSFETSMKEIVQRTAAGDGCRHVYELLANQATASEPQWRAILSIAQFCTDRDKAIHNVSRKHPEYDRDATEVKASGIKGPYTCAMFDSLTPGLCQDCKHRGKIKSPIVIGRSVKEAEPDDIELDEVDEFDTTKLPNKGIPKYPSPYFRGANGGVFKRDKDKEGNPKDVMVYFNDLYVVRRVHDVEAGEAVVMRLHLPRDGVREFTVPLTVVGTRDEFRKTLAMQGVAMINVAELMEYTMKWVNELQFVAEADSALRQFGWVDEAGTAFAIGDKVVYADRVENNAPSASTAGFFPYFETRGTLEGWKETMEFYNRPGMEPHQFMVGLQFGSALMEFQPINAAAFHMYSKESGLGKTTGMLAGASIWGNPDLIMMQERDTFNSKMNRAEVYKNLACYMDELTNTKPQDLSDWAYQLPSGLQRNRMGVSGNRERVRGKPWKTLFGTTGNTSMLERIALFKALPKAEAQRILEYRVRRVAFETKAETDEFATAVKEHYGHAGVVYIQYVIANLEQAIGLATTVQQRIDARSGMTAENRFWSALVSRTLAGITLAKCAGLITWDVPSISRWAVEMMKVAKNSAVEYDIDFETLLVEYLSENFNSTLRIKSTAKDPQSNSIDLTAPPAATPRGNAIIARYEYDIQRLYLLPKPLREWCGRQQINFLGLVEGLTLGRTKAQRIKYSMTRGTNMAMPPADVIMLQCVGFLDEFADVPVEPATK